MDGNNSNIRWNKVEEARRNIKAGLYDDEFYDDVIISRSNPDSLCSDLDICPIGNGDKYRDLTAETLISSLKKHIDGPLIRKELPVSKGRGDIDLPFRLQSLESVPLLKRWNSLYKLQSLFVEVKNLKNKGSLSDVRQIHDYLDTYTLGKVGFLVSRSGFTSNALKRISQIIGRSRVIIIPLDHNELKSIVNCPSDSTFTFFYRKEIMMRQAS